MSGRKTKLLIAERALDDIRRIEAYSVEEWGKRVAGRYLGDIEAALARIQADRGLLRAEADLHLSLQFYQVNKHLLVCDVSPNAVILLTVIHASRDIPSRLAELEPTLSAEVELLRKQLRGKGRKCP